MNVSDLRAFYKTPLGDVLQKEIQRLLHEFWPDFGALTQSTEALHALRSASVNAAFGYPLPYLDQDTSVITLFPSQLGGMRYPKECSRALLVDEQLLPLPDQCLDRLLVVHGFEYCHHPAFFLAECYRVLSREGKLLILTPNRRSLWAHQDVTPLGHGQPYSMTQLIRCVKSATFTVSRRMRGLYTPPHNSDLCISLCNVFETIGSIAAPKFSGMIAVECTKTGQTPALIKPLPLPALNTVKHALHM